MKLKSVDTFEFINRNSSIDKSKLRQKLCRANTESVVLITPKKSMPPLTKVVKQSAKNSVSTPNLLLSDNQKQDYEGNLSVVHSEQSQLESSSDSDGYYKARKSFPLSLVNTRTIGININETDESHEESQPSDSSIS